MALASYVIDYFVDLMEASGKGTPEYEALERDRDYTLTMDGDALVNCVLEYFDSEKLVEAVTGFGIAHPSFPYLDAIKDLDRPMVKYSKLGLPDDDEDKAPLEAHLSRIYRCAVATPISKRVPPEFGDVIQNALEKPEEATRVIEESLNEDPFIKSMYDMIMDEHAGDMNLESIMSISSKVVESMKAKMESGEVTSDQVEASTMKVLEKLTESGIL